MKSYLEPKHGRTVPASMTHPGRGRYPDATFDSFLINGVKVISSELRGGISVSDHNPVVVRLVIP